MVTHCRGCQAGSGVGDRGGGGDGGGGAGDGGEGEGGGGGGGVEGESGGGEGGTASAAPIAVRKQSAEKRRCEEGIFSAKLLLESLLAVDCNNYRRNKG